MSAQTVARPRMTLEEATACVREIREGIERAGRRLLDMYEREGWIALGYSNWRACAQAEFGFSQSRVYQLLNSAEVERNLSTMVEKLPERQARELVPYEPEVQKAVWDIAVRTAPVGDNGKPQITAAHIKSVATVLTDVVKNGGLDDGSGEIKPLGILIDAAVTEESYERLMRQKEHIRQQVATNHNESDGDEWYTPSEYIESVRRVLGKIDLDPASSAPAQAEIRAACYYTKDDDGLVQPWKGRVFLNPPYSYPLIERFTSRAIQQYETGKIKAAIVLTNNCTDAAWFQELMVRFPACLTRGRIPFWKPNQESFATRQGQAFFYLGPDTDEFIDEFGQYGTVVVKA